MITFEEFLRMEEADVVAKGDALHALWLEAKGDWDGAHAAAQRGGDRAGDWVHAYLHRVEGDAGNAGYWYARAGRKAPAAGMGFAAERAAIFAELWSAV
jgi:hypothetical protein